MPKKYRSIVKPTLDTPFKIDFSWWKEHDRNWRVYLRGLLCEEHKEAFDKWDDNTYVDWVDPRTAEIHPVDGLQFIIMTHCSQQPDFLAAGIPVVDAVFRILIASGNRPMTAVEIAERLNRPAYAQTLLRTLGRRRYYLGIRPVEG